MKKHSNLYYELGQGYRRRKVWGWIIAVAVIFLVVLAMVWWRMANAMDYPAIHKCIENYKSITQNGVKPLVDISQCVNHPTIIK